MIYYAGIGSRETPPNICNLMTRIAKRLYEKGWTLRSGGAKGADSAFEAGSTLSEIYLPYDGFEKKRQHHTGCYDAESFSNYQEARAIAAEFHPAWSRCSEWARKMHTRNVYQVLGMDLNTPSSCIICWTKNGGLNGGTSQAMRIAQAHNIPIFNLYFEDSIGKLAEFVRESEKDRAFIALVEEFKERLGLSYERNQRKHLGHHQWPYCSASKLSRCYGVFSNLENY